MMATLESLYGYARKGVHFDNSCDALIPQTEDGVCTVESINEYYSKRSLDQKLLRQYELDFKVSWYRLYNICVSGDSLSEHFPHLFLIS